LVSASLYFALRMAKTGATTWKGYCAVGLLIGTALLAKASAVLVVLFIVLALARQLAIEGASFTKWAGTLGSMLLIATLLCGWHYVSGFAIRESSGWRLGSRQRRFLVAGRWLSHGLLLRPLW